MPWFLSMALTNFKTLWTSSEAEAVGVNAAPTAEEGKEPAEEAPAAPEPEKTAE